MGEKDFHPLSANFLYDKWIKSHWDNYVQGKTNVGQKACPLDWRVARTIMVADDDKVAKDYGRNSEQSPYRFYYRNLYHKLRKGKRDAVFSMDGKTPENPVPLDEILDNLVIAGGVNEVVDRILALHEKCGRLWRTGVCRPRLGRPGTGASVHGADGRGSHAPCQQGPGPLPHGPLQRLPKQYTTPLQELKTVPRFSCSAVRADGSRRPVARSPNCAVLAR